MTQQHNTGAGPSIRIGDIYYVLFRHKWKILFISLIGLSAATYLYFSGWEVNWMSQSKLLVKYVVESKQPTPSPTEGLKSVEESPISTELEILSSVDVAAETASRLRPDIIARLTNQTDTTNTWEEAVGPIQKGLKLEVPNRSSVIEVGFQHPDREVVRPVLQELIMVYLNKHVSIHQGQGLFDRALENQTSSLKNALRETENQLREARAKVGVVSVEESKRFNIEQLQKLRHEMFEAQTELQVGQQTIAMYLASRQHTNTADGEPQITSQVPAAKAAEYGRIRGQLENLAKREQDYLVSFTPESVLVKGVREQIEAQMKAKEQLESEYPSLMTAGVAGAPTGLQDPISKAAYSTNALSIRLASLAAQIKFYDEENKRLEAAEAEINELQRDKERQEQSFKYFSMTWDQTQANSKLRDAGTANISEIQRPSLPFHAPSKRLKAIAMIALGSIAGALALAFALEFVVDRSFRRASDVERQLGLPLLISIPRMRLNGRAKPMLPAGAKMISNGEGDAAETGDPSRAVAKRGANQPWQPHPALCPFAETLRDRLITYFEMKGLTHKPKLVAVTSCGEGAGVSTVSAGLAASLSETGEGNVLLVDMNMRNGAAHQFHKGELARGIDELLELDKREGSMVQDKLYLASEGGTSDSMPSVLPQRFKNLVPKIKASDYDYIIFDMPPVSQISMTPRLAKFMDMVLMIVESEKTDRDVVKRATNLLSESKTNVGVVLNKSRRYVPKALQQEMA